MTPHDHIIEAVTRATGITLEQMRERNRKREICDARRMVCGLSREYNCATLYTIAEAFGWVSNGQPDHAAVIHYVKTHGYIYSNTPMYRSLSDAAKAYFVTNPHYRGLADRSGSNTTATEACRKAWGGVQLQTLTQ